ncbi:MAG: type III-A CRISPR-associated protein Csm2 [Hyphomicrobiales bacterium]
MFKEENISDKYKWGENKISSFHKLYESKESYLQFHKETKNKTLNVIQKFLYFNNEDITPTQLRNIYNQILEVKDNPSGLTLKRIKLAYIAGRTETKKKGLHNLLKLLDELFELANGETEKYKGVKAFCEAIVAYHKYYHTLNIKPIQNK